MSLKQVSTVIALLIVVFSGIVLLRGDIDFNNLSEKQLLDADYYLYIVSQTYQEQMGWQRKISMKSFDWHCTQNMDSRSDRWNYINVQYTDENNNSVLDIRISPNDALFDEEIAKSIQIGANFDALYDPQHYEVENINMIKLVNPQGIEIVITSHQSLETTETALDALTLIGNINEPNPWVENCE